MIKGIGVDTTDIYEIKEMLKCESFQHVFITHTFTAREIAVAKTVPEPAEYLSSRFAAKEAVFKATAHLTNKKSYDMRIIETLNHEDGSPYISVGPQLKDILEEIHVTELFISITTEGHYATAFVIAQS